MKRLWTGLMTGVVAGMVASGGASWVEDSMIPREMVLVAHGPSVMGLDKEQPPDLGKKLTAYEKRMRTPWSAEALNDEGPAHDGEE